MRDKIMWDRVALAVIVFITLVAIVALVWVLFGINGPRALVLGIAGLCTIMFGIWSVNAGVAIVSMAKNSEAQRQRDAVEVVRSVADTIGSVVREVNQDAHSFGERRLRTEEQEVKLETARVKLGAAQVSAGRLTAKAEPHRQFDNASAQRWLENGMFRIPNVQGAAPSEAEDGNVGEDW